jgi:dCMP deaminase
MKKAIIVYVPVPHLGYLSLFKRHQPADILLLTTEVISLLDVDVGARLGRDFQLRAIPYEMIKKTLDGEFEGAVHVVRDLAMLSLYEQVVLPDEKVSDLLLPWINGKHVITDNWFVRWDWNNTTIPKEVASDYMVSGDEFHKEIMQYATSISKKSSDFWRQVGAVALLDKPLVAFNEHLPTNMEPYINGDMRIIMKPGESPEICGALHAEKAIIAYAASESGISLRGVDLYVTTFPCLPCAQQIAFSGIKRIFFREGYSNQNAQEVLRSKDITIIRVQE